MTTKEKTNLMTPVFRCSFPKLIDPGQSEDGRKVYEVTGIFDADSDFTAMKQLVQDTIKEKFGDKNPGYLRLPFRKGIEKSEANPNGYDLEKYPMYEGKVIISMRSYGQQPGIVDTKLQDILDASEIYPGMYGRATIRAYYYDNKGGKGISFSLQNFQKIKDGERFGGGRTKAENDFEAFDTPEDEAQDNSLDMLDI